MEEPIQETFPDFSEVELEVLTSDSVTQPGPWYSLRRGMLQICRSCCNEELQAKLVIEMYPHRLLRFVTCSDCRRKVIAPLRAKRHPDRSPEWDGWVWLAIGLAGVGGALSTFIFQAIQRMQ